MQKIRGRLLYSKFFMPWEFLQDNGEVINLRPFIDKFLMSIDGKCLKHELGWNGVYYIRVIEKKSVYFSRVPFSFKNQDGFMMFNAYAELDAAFSWFANAIMEVEIEDGKQFVMTLLRGDSR